MLKTLSLILPVMLPSWRFFKTIEPSPRVQWALLDDGGKASGDWQDFRPQPLTVTPLQMLARLFWNAARNDALFVVSCAERIALGPTQHSIAEITRRIQADFETYPPGAESNMAQFRLAFVSRNGAGVSQEILFLSDPFSIKDASEL